LATFQLIQIQIEVKKYSFRIFTLLFKCDFVTKHFNLLFTTKRFKFFPFYAVKNETQMRQETAEKS
jgi:hypothetical protein